jgi:tRNA(fMet)-specific endonuclease VapC
VSHLLDTNAIVHMMKLREPLVSRARAADPSTLAVTTITLAELWYGTARSQRPRRTRAEQDAALAPFRILHFDADAADRYASVRARLAVAGQLIGDRDLMIAAIALANRLTVITSNIGEFTRLPELKVED